MEKLPYNKAFKYSCNFTTSYGENCTITSIVALSEMSPSIEVLIDRWTKQSRSGRTNHVYTLLEELDIAKAVNVRGLRGGTIRNDYKLLNKEFCSIEIDIEYHHSESFIGSQTVPELLALEGKI